jgi:hypothetical protein
MNRFVIRLEITVVVVIGGVEDPGSRDERREPPTTGVSGVRGAGPLPTFIRW